MLKPGNDPHIHTSVTLLLCSENFSYTLASLAPGPIFSTPFIVLKSFNTFIK